MSKQLIDAVFNRIGLEDYLKGAEDTARWIRSLEKKTDKGSYWVPEKVDDKEYGRVDMYFGSSGIILFFISLADASGNPEYLNDARRGGDYILDQFETFGSDCLNRRQIYLSQYHDGIRWSYTVGGVSGVAYALAELGSATGDKKYTDAAIAYTEMIVANAHENEHGLDWGGKSGISFDSGTILYLLYAGKKFGRPNFTEAANKGGHAILTTGLKAKVGTRFMGLRNIVKEMTGIDDVNYDVPNFYYGTSGIAYTFARLYQETKEEAYLTAAREGAAYVASVAVTDGEAALVPYRIPDKQDLYYLGNCHGVTGTARLYYILYDITGEDFYREWTEKLVNGLEASGAPELRSPGYWNCYSFCCGTAGFLDLYAALYLKTNDRKWLNLARRSAKVLISEGSLSMDGFNWHQAFDRTDTDAISTDPGYFSGAAGNADALLQLWFAEHGKAPVFRQPDEPFVTRG